jgi:fumarate reductase flavoprotein subunit
VEAHPNCEFIGDANVVNLIAGDEGDVRGVVVQHGSRLERVQAAKVILACNGFAGNPELVREHCPAMAGALYFGGEGNTGEGILWGVELGGVTAFMDAYQAHASVALPHAILITYAIIMEGGIQVNIAGRRFGDETSGYSEHALAVLAQPDATAWDIYDERLHQLGRQFDDYRQAEEIGAIVSAPSLADLALQIAVPAGALTETVAAYNHAAAGAAADPWGRSDCRRLEAPYYAARVTGALFHTQGGLLVDEDARVLRADGSPVPNLYAGGGTAAGISGHGPGGYLSGNGLLTAIGYGMLAGRHAARVLQA